MTPCSLARVCLLYTSQLEPDNEEYRRFLDELQHGGTVYSNYSSGFPAGDWITPNKLCLGLCAAQFLLRFCFCRC